MRFGRSFASISSIPALVLCLAVAACSGEDGSPGPAGAQGPKGDPGAAGLTGANGTAGTNGTNGTNGTDGGAAGDAGDAGDAGAVIYSDWLSVKFTLDTEVNTYYANINAPDLTNEVLTKGDVRVYINTGSAASPVLYSLPLWQSSGLYAQVVTYAGGITLDANGDLSTFVNTKGETNYQYRYVITKGNTPASK